MGEVTTYAFLHKVVWFLSILDNMASHPTFLVPITIQIFYLYLWILNLTCKSIYTSVVCRELNNRQNLRNETVHCCQSMLRSAGRGT
jgi:hypothetical protein